MARISTYIKDTVVTGDDFVIGSDGNNQNRTSQFGVDALAAYITRNSSIVFSARLLYGYSDELGMVPDLFDDDGNVIPKYAGVDDGSIPDGSLDGMDPGGPFDQGTPARPPYFEIKHNLGTEDIDVLVFRRVEHSPETRLWTSSNTSVIDGNEVNTITTTESRYSPYTPVGGVFIIDPNTVHIDFNAFELYDVQVIISGATTPEE